MLLIIFLLLVRQSIIHLKELIRTPKQFCTNIWNIIDILILLMTITNVLLYVIGIYMTGNLLQILYVSKGNQFVQYQKVFKFLDISTIIAALLICLITLRLWKFLRFGKTFRILEKTITSSIKPLACLAFLHCFVVFSFTILTWMIFGRQSSYFSSFYKAGSTYMLMIFGFRNWASIESECK